MDDGSIAELRRLQLRAYAPDGDIQTDDGALRRLEELEDLSRVRMFEAKPDPAEAERVEISPDGVDGVPVVAAVEPAVTQRPALRRRWWALLWAASLIVVGGVVMGTALTAPPRAPQAAGAHYVATLAEDPDFTWPKFLGDQEHDAVGFRDYLGLTAVAIDGSVWGANAEKCFLLMATEKIGDSDGFNGPIYSGCGAGAFPATVEMRVGGDLPTALLQRFPEGSAIQFVLDGSRIDVYSDAD